MNKRPTLLTEDQRLEPGSAEVAALTEGPFLVIKSPEQFMALAEAARATKDAFDETARKLMSIDRARVLRSLRGSSSWREIAAAAHAWRWGEWNPPTNQLMGMALCEAAARMLGEDPAADPWN